MGDSTTNRTEADSRADIYQRIIDRIAAAIEAGAITSIEGTGGPKDV